MKKIGSVLLLVLGVLLTTYGLAFSKGGIFLILSLACIIWVILSCVKYIKNKKLVQIGTIVMFVLLTAISVLELSHITKIPTYMIGVEQAKVEYVLLHCPHVFMLLGAVLILIGAHVIRSMRNGVVEG